MILAHDCDETKKNKGRIEKVALVVAEILGPSMGGSLGAAGKGGDEIVTGYLLRRAAVNNEMKM